jgi:hypothetical protein
MTHAVVHKTKYMRGVIPAEYTLYKVTVNTTKMASGHYVHYLVGPLGICEFYSPSTILGKAWGVNSKFPPKERFARALLGVDQWNRPCPLVWKSIIHIAPPYKGKKHPPQFGSDSWSD